MDQQLKTMIDNMPEKTGKSLEQWIQLLSNQSFIKHSEAVNFLKQEHGVSHGFANTIVHLSKTEVTETEDLVATQFMGKDDLKAIYDQLIAEIQRFGSDIELAPKKAYVSIRRSKQFAIIQPSTKTRLDVGINLKDYPVTSRLEKSGSFNAMVSHRVKVNEAVEVNEELINWLKLAYQQA